MAKAPKIIDILKAGVELMRKNFFVKNLLLFLIPLLIPLLILGTQSIIITQHYVKEEINKNNINLLKQTEGNIELILNELDSLSLNFDTNPQIVYNLKRILRSPSLSMEDMSLLSTIRSFIDTPANSRPYIQSIYVYFTNSGSMFLTTSDGLVKLDGFYDTSWYKSFTNQKKSTNIWTESRAFKHYDFDPEDTRVITIYKKLYSPGSDAVQGVIVLNIHTDYLENLLKNLVTYPGQSILIIDERNNIIFSNKDSANIKSMDLDLDKLLKNKLTFFEFKSAKQSYVVSKLSSGRYGWKFVSAIPQKSLYGMLSTLIISALLLLALSLILGLALTYFLTKRNYNHIMDVISIINAAECERPLPPLPSRDKDEYGYIIRNILKTFIEQSYLKVQISEKKYRFETMELLALQSQLNPHFLFNTLETINWKVLSLTGKPTIANKMVEDLSDILKYSLSDPSSKIRMDEEIKNTLSYIAIQKIRYKDKFDVIWEYEDHVKEYKTIKLLMQPLIENSIYHGIKEKEGHCLIKIRINVINNLLRISIIDNGLGIEYEKLKQLKSTLNDSREYYEHIGLFNTNKRLKLIYGDACGIEIRSRYYAGTAVYVHIPLEI